MPATHQPSVIPAMEEIFFRRDVPTFINIISHTLPHITPLTFTYPLLPPCNSIPITLQAVGGQAGNWAAGRRMLEEDRTFPNLSMGWQEKKPKWARLPSPASPAHSLLSPSTGAVHLTVPGRSRGVEIPPLWTFILLGQGRFAVAGPQVAGAPPLGQCLNRSSQTWAWATTTWLGLRHSGRAAKVHMLHLPGVPRTHRRSERAGGAPGIGHWKFLRHSLSAGMNHSGMPILGWAGDSRLTTNHLPCLSSQGRT